MTYAVIFDMDGLMVSSTSTWQITERNFLKTFDRHYDRYIAKSYQGMRASGVVKKMIEAYELPISQREGEYLFKKQLVNSYQSSQLRLLPGCIKLISSLYHSNEFSLSVASSSPICAIEAVIERFSLSKYFDIIVSGEEVEHGKPSPDIFLRCSRLLNLNPKSCIVLEDAPNGIQAAISAGMSAIAVYKYGMHNSEDFINFNSKIVTSLEDVNIVMISKILKNANEAKLENKKIYLNSRNINYKQRNRHTMSKKDKIVKMLKFSAANNKKIHS